MNKNVNAKIVMYQRVLDILEKNEVAWNDKPAYVSAFSKFTDTLVSIQDHLQDRDKPITGFAEEKRQVRKELTQLVRDASTLLTVYAKANKNVQLKVRQKVTSTGMNQLREADLQLHISRVLSDIDQHLAELSDYGITVEIKDLITAKFNDWTTLVQAPREAINERKAEGFAIQQLIKAGDLLLHETIDLLMLPFQTALPEFYFKYNSARMIIEARGRNDDVEPPKGGLFLE